ncbi:ankyrin repeat domain-containing protein [Leptospira ilyithenensis]|uniref:Ankyrin repeat domain-containing protein n=1 Tax=Leptospira ilyithenensis TaxID=2484901 RepID=A0A4R9LRB3_9LEPT|nr:ankyrin repeat domain-containing protein [Leptospira ilyithenensis]
MKAVLTCTHCRAQHHISEAKILGKKGKFFCKFCRFENSFNFKSTNAQIGSAFSYNLNFSGDLPTNPVIGWFEGKKYEELSFCWIEDKLEIIPSSAGNLKKDLSISILGLSYPRKIKGFRFDVIPGDPGSPQRQILGLRNFSTNSSYRLSITVIEETESAVTGLIYLALPDPDKTYLYGRYKAEKMHIINFLENGSYDKNLPSYLSNFVSAKAYSLAGSILYLQECFTRLTEEEKLQLLELLIESWVVDSSSDSHKFSFSAENVVFNFILSEKKMMESLVFFLANHVLPSNSIWAIIEGKIKNHPSLEFAFLQVFKKRFPDEIQKISGNNEQTPTGPLERDPSVAIQKDDHISLSALLDSGLPIDYLVEDTKVNPFGFNILHESFYGLGAKCGLLLLEKGANPNFLDKNGETPLFKICQNNEMALKDKVLLLDAILPLHANVDHQSNSGMTSLHWCSMFCEPTIAKKLIQSGANIHLLDNQGFAALHEACRYGNTSVLALLLEAGADAKLLGKNGKSGRDFATHELENAELEGDEEKKAKFQRILSLLAVYGG